jgi:hypothetical protein
MEFQHVNVKLFVKNAEQVDLEALVPVFHGWIQNQGSGELLLDVADYRHVPSGPGVVLIGHQGNYSLDNAGGRLGVRYNRKAPVEGTNHDRLVRATQAALSACRRLETEPSLGGTIQFNGRDIEVFINDRLLAANTLETRVALDSEFRTFFSTLFGEVEYTVSYPQDSRSLFSVHVRTSQAFDTTELLDNLNSLEPASRQ